jgi:hydrogenase nickel incorporation protein HypB
MGRFHRHDDGATHAHDHPHDHPHDVGDHSGYGTGRLRIAILEDVLAENDRAAAANRAALDAAGVHAVNLMSAPGSGKTTLLARTLAALRGRCRVGVVEGDIETPLDAERLSGFGAQVALLNTGDGFGGECHLDAPMVARALADLDLAALDLLLVENVGNLVCPAEFDVGEHRRAMIWSLTEGEDKPLKYPVMFRAADAVVVNKTDLAPHLDVDLARFRRHLADVNPDATVLELSARTGEGVGAWLAWLRAPLGPPLGTARP